MKPWLLCAALAAVSVASPISTDDSLAASFQNQTYTVTNATGGAVGLNSNPTDPEFIYAIGYQSIFSRYAKRSGELRVPPSSAVLCAESARRQLGEQLERAQKSLADVYPLPAFHFMLRGIDKDLAAVLVFLKQTQATYQDVLTWIGTFETWAEEWSSDVPSTEIAFAQAINHRWQTKGAAYFQVLDDRLDANVTAS